MEAKLVGELPLGGGGVAGGARGMTGDVHCALYVEKKDRNYCSFDMHSNSASDLEEKMTESQLLPLPYAVN